MSTVIAIANPKGGSGKTTLATNLAVALAMGQRRVVLVDSDPQGSARDWAAAAAASLVPVVGIDRPVLEREVRGLGFDVAVIDGAPGLSPLTTSAVKAADLVVIPVQPSPLDLWAVSDLVDLVKARQEVTDGSPRAVFAVTRAVPGTILGREVAEALAGYGFPLLGNRLHQRQVYAACAAEGKSVVGTRTEAAAEVIGLAAEVWAALEGAARTDSHQYVHA